MAQAQDTHIYAMAQTQTSPEEQAALHEVMQLLEATPDTAAPTGIVSLGFTPDANDIPAKREKLAILVSTGKSKEANWRAAHTRAGQTPVRQGRGKVQQKARSLHWQQDNRVADWQLPLARQQRPCPGG